MKDRLRNHFRCNVIYDFWLLVGSRQIMTELDTISRPTMTPTNDQYAVAAHRLSRTADDACEWRHLYKQCSGQHDPQDLPEHSNPNGLTTQLMPGLNTTLNMLFRRVTWNSAIIPTKLLYLPPSTGGPGLTLQYVNTGNWSMALEKQWRN